jgi:dTDP-4-amino-4,6-dideoxygalactose transaminase
MMMPTAQMPPAPLALFGGTPVRSSLLPLTSPWMDEREVAAVADAVRNGWLIGAGRQGRQVEQQLAQVLGVNRALLVNSCTAALEAAVLLSRVGAGDEVILPSFTFVSCANAVVRAGARPVFADVDPATFNVDPASLERLIGPRTRAVMVVHYGGRPCDMGAILELASARGIRVIEDAAHALGGSWQGQPLGTVGDFGCFSFHGSKDVVCGEGGALVCRDPDDTRAAEILREKGTNRAAFLRGEVNKYEWVSIGGSLILSDVLAALLAPQLERLPTMIERKRHLARRLSDALAPLGDRIALPRWSDESSWHLYPVLVPPAARDAVLAALKAEGIGASFHFVPLHDSPYGRKHFGYATGDLPCTERVSESLVRLPLFAAMSDGDLDDVIEAARKVIGQLVTPAAATADASR